MKERCTEDCAEHNMDPVRMVCRRCGKTMEQIRSTK